MTGSAAVPPAERVRTLLEIGRTDEARTVVESALAADPQNADLALVRAQVLVAQRDWRAAVQAANLAVRLAPDHEDAHILCSMALRQLGNTPEAARAAAESIRLAPHRWSTHASYALAMRKANPQLAQRAAREAVERGPNEAEAHFVLGLVHHGTGRRSVARAAYRRAIELDPEHDGALHNMALLERRLTRQARGLFHALRLDPQDPLYQQNVAKLLSSLFARTWAAVAILLLVLAGADAIDPGAHWHHPPPVLWPLPFLVGAVVAMSTLRVLHAFPPGSLRVIARSSVRSGATAWFGILSVCGMAAAAYCYVVPYGIRAAANPFTVRTCVVTLVVIVALRAYRTG